eukprot:scaffold651267_cov42-Prasinocladus_malaysianus.AAC.1
MLSEGGVAMPRKFSAKVTCSPLACLQLGTQVASFSISLRWGTPPSQTKPSTTASIRTRTRRIKTFPACQQSAGVPYRTVRVVAPRGRYSWRANGIQDETIHVDVFSSSSNAAIDVAGAMQNQPHY